MLKKIVVIGPESTGKSTLCEQLAAHYKTLWCPEFAREYLLQHGMDYTYDDLLTIAKGQLQLEDSYTELKSQKSKVKNTDSSTTHDSRLTIHDSRFTTHHSPLFIDTDMYVMKVWCEYVFGKCHQFILDEIAKRKYDLYLLCNIDLPWTKDELREYPEEGPRAELFQIYKKIMQNQSTRWVQINGMHEQRLQQAIEAIDKLLMTQEV